MDWLRGLWETSKEDEHNEVYGEVESPEGLADRCEGFNLYSKHFCAYKIGYFAKVSVFWKGCSNWGFISFVMHLSTPK